MADKAVERVEPPYPDHWDASVKGDDVAYVVVYTHVDDSIESVAFNKTGGEVKRMAGDFRRPATKGVTQAVGRAEAPKPTAEALSHGEPAKYAPRSDSDWKPGKLTPEVIPGVPAVGHADTPREQPLPSKTLPEPETKPLRPKP